MDGASSQAGDLALPLPAGQRSAADFVQAIRLCGLEQAAFQELWLAADGAAVGLTVEEFLLVLTRVGAKSNYGLPTEAHPDAEQRMAFLRSLHLSELALAHACALGRDAGWQHFLSKYRASLTQAAVAITGSATLGHEIADSLYAELYGLREFDGQRRSPLASYSGRGSLLGWLRTTLAQRHVDHHRRTRGEVPLDSLDTPAATLSISPQSAELARLGDAVSRSLKALGPEDRYLLSSYFLDRHTLLEISRVLRVHEATVSRRLKRLVAELRERLLQNLRSAGLSKRAAEEALGTDPRDLELNLCTLLQTSQISPFPDETGSALSKALSKR